MLLAGCGGGSSSSTAADGTTGPATTPAGAPGSVSVAAGSTVPLGLSAAQLEARIGTPAGSPQPRKGGFHCLLYRLQGEPPFVKLQYCFRHDRLKFLSTYAVTGGAAGSR